MTIWEMREEFREAFPDPATAVAQALALDAAPVVIAEISDNSGGGAPGDGTYLLRALLEANMPGTAFGFITDAEVARQAHEAGVGATITIALGGKSDDLHGEPVETEAYVKGLTDGRFRLTNPMGAGSEVDLGRMTRLIIGNVDVLVASDRAQTLDPEVFLLHGIDVTRYKIIALKSQQHSPSAGGCRAKQQPKSQRLLIAAGRKRSSHRRRWCRSRAKRRTTSISTCPRRWLQSPARKCSSTGIPPKSWSPI